jgi:hypothetical protein
MTAMAASSAILLAGQLQSPCVGPATPADRTAPRCSRPKVKRGSVRLSRFAGTLVTLRVATPLFARLIVAGMGCLLLSSAASAQHRNNFHAFAVYPLPYHYQQNQLQQQAARAWAQVPVNVVSCIQNSYRIPISDFIVRGMGPNHPTSVPYINGCLQFLADTHPVPSVQVPNVATVQPSNGTHQVTTPDRRSTDQVVLTPEETCLRARKDVYRYAQAAADYPPDWDDVTISLAQKFTSEQVQGLQSQADAICQNQR